jgi:hypothetical protein
MVNQQLLFLKEKIQDINSAIFFNLSDAVLKLPTSIITTLKVDEFGYVWFFVERPKQQLNEFEKEFPARMDYFRKGKDYSLQIMGKAWIVTDPEELAMAIDLSDEVKQKALSQMVLVKVKMMKADMFENITGLKTSWLRNALTTLQEWIFPNSGNYGPTTYYPVSQAS